MVTQQFISAQVARFSTEFALVFFHSVIIAKFLKGKEYNGCKKIRMTLLRTKTSDRVVFLNIGESCKTCIDIQFFCTIFRIFLTTKH